MASAKDTANRKSGCDQSQMSFNQNMAESQRNKTIFRAHKVALSADPFNPNRLTSNNAVSPAQQAEFT